MAGRARSAGRMGGAGTGGEPRGGRRSRGQVPAQRAGFDCGSGPSEHGPAVALPPGGRSVRARVSGGVRRRRRRPLATLPGAVLARCLIRLIQRAAPIVRDRASRAQRSAPIVRCMACAGPARGSNRPVHALHWCSACPCASGAWPTASSAWPALVRWRPAPVQCTACTGPLRPRTCSAWPALVESRPAPVRCTACTGRVGA